MKSSDSSLTSSTASLASSSNSLYLRSSRHGSRRATTYRKRNSYDSNLSVNSNSNSNSNNNNELSSNTNSNNNFNGVNANNDNGHVNMELAQTNYQNLLSIFSNIYKPRTNFLIQTPDYPRGNPLFHTNRLRESLPRRLCGDWSSKLKLLRYVSGGSYLGLHFVSDYSHHYGGYKAKVFMENSEYLLYYVLWYGFILFFVPKNDSNIFSNSSVVFQFSLQTNELEYLNIDRGKIVLFKNSFLSHINDFIPAHNGKIKR